LVPVTDCLNWLQDLQRALRRDEDLYRPISLLLGKWNVVQQKLLPLVMTCRYDTPIVLTVVKILVILTKPLSDNTKRAGQIVIDTTSPKSDPNVVVQQIKIRENALQQAERLMEYKRFVTFHPSHHHTKKQSNNNNKSNSNKDRAGGTGLLSIFVSLLAEPLSKSGASRTDADHLTIELVLHLIRNLLSAEPLLNSKLLFNLKIYIYVKKIKGKGKKKSFIFKFLYSMIL
jgi:timeless